MAKPGTPQPPVQPTTLAKAGIQDELLENGTRLITVGQIKTLDQLLTEAQVNLVDWKVASFEVNKWDVHSTRLGKPLLMENWQVKAKLEAVKFVTQLTVDEVASQLRQLLPKRPRRRGRPAITRTPGCMFELAIFDAHLGKLCDPLESGGTYNLEVASALYLQSVEALLQRAQGYDIEEFLLPIGNDFFNSDHKSGSTTAGTPQHEASRWRTTFSRGAALIVNVIERLRQIAPVKVVLVHGNHDEQTNYFLGEVLAGTYRKDLDVTIDHSQPSRKYVQWGKCLLGFTHGNMEKQAELPHIMATEQKKLWAETTYREWHVGHTHHLKVTRNRPRVQKSVQVEAHEHMGVVVRVLRSLSDVDDWHYQKAYIGSIRAAEGFIFHKEEGLIGQFSVNV